MKKSLFTKLSAHFAFICTIALILIISIPVFVYIQDKYAPSAISRDRNEFIALKDIKSCVSGRPMNPHFVNSHCKIVSQAIVEKNFFFGDIKAQVIRIPTQTSTDRTKGQIRFLNRFGVELPIPRIDINDILYHYVAIMYTNKDNIRVNSHVPLGETLLYELRDGKWISIPFVLPAGVAN